MVGVNTQFVHLFINTGPVIQNLQYDKTLLKIKRRYMYAYIKTLAFSTDYIVEILPLRKRFTSSALGITFR